MNSPAPARSRAPRARAPRCSRSGCRATAATCRRRARRGGRRSARGRRRARRSRARGRRARRAGRGRPPPAGETPEGGRHRRRSGTSSARGAPWTSRRSSCMPRAVEGGEDGVGLDGADVGHEQARGAVDVQVSQRLLHPLVACAREGRDVGGEVERGRAGLARELRQLLLGPALAEHEVGAALAQRLAQLGEAAVEEPGAVGGREAPLQQAWVEHEDGHDAVVLAVGGGEGRVVVDAQVAAQPDEGGGRAHPRGTGERRT